MRPFLIFTILLAFAADAQALCLRCRHASCSGNPCNYVKPVAGPVYEKTDVFVIQANYPNSPLVGQGTSAVVSNGGYQAAALQYFDVNRYLSQQYELRKASNEADAIADQRMSSFAAQVASDQAPIALLQARVDQWERAGKMIGLTLPSSTPQSFLLTVSGNQVTQQALTLDQVQALLSGQQPIKEPSSKYELTAKNCYSCHGMDLAQPKGGFFIGPDLNVATKMDSVFRKMKNMVESGEMPKGATLTADEKLKVIDELNAMIEEGLAKP